MSTTVGDLRFLYGEVDLHYRDNGDERTQTMRRGDIWRAGIGDERVAHPRGEARIRHAVTRKSRAAPNGAVQVFLWRSG